MAASEHELEAVYRARYAAFRRALTPIVGDSQAAHDAVQEAFARALRERRGYRGDGSLEAWIWRIAFRVALGLRRDPREVELAGALDRGATVGVESDPGLTGAIRALPPRRRLVVFLRYFADLSYADIAYLCRISEGTVAATLSQSHAELAAALSTEGAVL